jgi:hypothetical protein
MAQECDAVFVIGAPNSSNSLRLVECAERAGAKAQLIQRGTDIDFGWLEGVRTLGITAGASAPEVLVREVVDTLAARFAVSERTGRSRAGAHGIQAAQGSGDSLMAVYTHVPAEEMAQFLTRYDTGALVSAKGIAEGVENSNYMLETRRPDGEAERFILTLYEKRVDEADLPFFMDLLDHLGARGCKVPRFIADRDGQQKLQHLVRAARLPDRVSLRHFR